VNDRQYSPVSVRLFYNGIKGPISHNAMLACLPKRPCYVHKPKDRAALLLHVGQLYLRYIEL